VVVIRASGWRRGGGATPCWLVVTWQQCHIVVVVVGDGRRCWWGCVGVPVPVVVVSDAGVSDG
jgi:hypothetical protein